MLGDEFWCERIISSCGFPMGFLCFWRKQLRHCQETLTETQLPCTGHVCKCGEPIFFSIISIPVYINVEKSFYFNQEAAIRNRPPAMFFERFWGSGVERLFRSALGGIFRHGSERRPSGVKLTMLAKGPFLKGNFIFQVSMFRGCVSFQGRTFETPSLKLTAISPLTIIVGLLP